MKKFYTLILSLAVCCFTASAADWDIVLNVIEGAERVKAVVGENADDTDVQVIELVNGENKIHIPSYEALYFPICCPMTRLRGVLISTAALPDRQTVQRFMLSLGSSFPLGSMPHFTTG